MQHKDRYHYDVIFTSLTFVYFCGVCQNKLVKLRDVILDLPAVEIDGKLTILGADRSDVCLRFSTLYVQQRLSGCPFGEAPFSYYHLLYHNLSRFIAVNKDFSISFYIILPVWSVRRYIMKISPLSTEPGFSSHSFLKI